MKFHLEFFNPKKDFSFDSNWQKSETCGSYRMNDTFQICEDYLQCEEMKMDIVFLKKLPMYTTNTQCYCTVGVLSLAYSEVEEENVLQFLSSKGHCTIVQFFDFLKSNFNKFPLRAHPAQAQLLSFLGGRAYLKTIPYVNWSHWDLTKNMGWGTCQRIHTSFKGLVFPAQQPPPKRRICPACPSQGLCTPLNIIHMAQQRLMKT